MRTIALKYLEGFACIGADCEDDCCTGWGVTVDEAHYRALETRLGESDEGRAEFARSLKVLDQPTKHLHAMMVLDERNRCSMLGPDRLCKIHGRFGESLLPDTCAVFPRLSGVVGNHFEVSASISCPEIARRALLVEGATDPMEVPADSIVRSLVYYNARGNEGPYQASFEAVRTMMLGVLSQRRVPLRSRLGALAWFSEQTRSFLHKQTTGVDENALLRLFQLLRKPETLDRLHQQVEGARVSEPFAASVLQQVLAGACANPAPVLVRLIEEALSRDGDEDPGHLWEAHRERTAALPAATVEKLERALEAFCKNFAFKDWYLNAPSFARWLSGLIVRVAILRYLITGHAQAHSAPERAIVEVAYSLSRTFEHDDSSMARVLDALEAQKMQSLPHAIALLTF